jgi:hypothetical protein
MCDVQMNRTEPGLVSIPLEKAVYCVNCRTVSSSAKQLCGLCGSEQITRLARLIPEPWDSGPDASSCHGRIAGKPLRASI